MFIQLEKIIDVETIFHDELMKQYCHFFTEGGDKEKLECFVDFCEDAIFEMQHAESLMKADDSGGGKKESSGPSLPSEDAPRYCGFNF